MRPLLVLAALVVMLSACATEQNPSPQQPDDLTELTRWMTGSFSSQSQSQADTTYRDVRLEVTRIWPQRADGVWLYVEQAVAEYLDRPYRQRVYHLRATPDGRMVSAIFTLSDPLRFAGVWKQSDPLAALSPDSLEARDGCEVYLTRAADDAFVGGTIDDRCPSSLRGASYATTEVRIHAGGMISWDQGFDADGNQVWGATESGYVFDRVAPPLEPQAGEEGNE